MRRENLTNSQEAFVSTDAGYKIYFGGRQIGKTTGLAFDAIERATDGDDVVATGPVFQMSALLLDRIKDLASTPPHMSQVSELLVTECTTNRGGHIRTEQLEELVPSTSQRYHGEKSSLEGYDHLVVDEIDSIDPDIFDELVERAVWHNMTISVSGTPKTDSPNIERLVDDDLWYSVHDTPISSEITVDAHVKDMADIMGTRQEVLELHGLFVSDPSESVDYSTPNEEDEEP